MRIWGRVYDEQGNNPRWQVVETALDGSNDYVRLTNLIQVLKLARNESPFYADWGIPAQLSIIQQVFPDYYVAATQAQFAPFFASLIIAKLPGPTPIYRISVMTHQGVAMNMDVPV